MSLLFTPWMKRKWPFTNHNLCETERNRKEERNPTAERGRKVEHNHKAEQSRKVEHSHKAERSSKAERSRNRRRGTARLRVLRSAEWWHLGMRLQP